MDELQDAIRKAIFAQRQHEAQQRAKNTIVDKLVDAHDFPVPEVFVDRQIENRVEQSLRAMAAQGIDPRKLNLDWDKVKESQREKAVREVKASMLLGRIAERESIDATRDEVDREVERIARQKREPFAAVQMRFEKDGTLGRIASHIQTEKTLNFLFEHARKTAESRDVTAIPGLLIVPAYRQISDGTVHCAFHPAGYVVIAKGTQFR